MGARKIIAAVATSADGFIARPDGDVSWHDRPRPKGRYGPARFYRAIDTVVMRRKTFAAGQAFGQPYDPGTKSHVLSSRRTNGPAEIEFVRGPVRAFARKTLRRAKRGKNDGLAGGAATIGAFLDAGEWDAIHSSRSDAGPSSRRSTRPARSRTAS